MRGAKLSCWDCCLCNGSSGHRSCRLGCSKSSIASESPLISVRGCGPKPPPCRPFFGMRGARYFPGSMNFAETCVGDCSEAPQRIQSKRARSTPAAAAEGGSKLLEPSTQAHTLFARLACERKDKAVEVRPEHSAPMSSVMAPTGRPPSNKESSGTIPVSTTGRTSLGVGVSADRILGANAVSTLRRTAEASGMKAHLYSPNIRLNCTYFVKGSIAEKLVQELLSVRKDYVKFPLVCAKLVRKKGTTLLAYLEN